MRRYLSSFLITAISYSLFAATLFYLFDNNEAMQRETNIASEKYIAISLTEPKPLEKTIQKALPKTPFVKEKTAQKQKTQKRKVKKEKKKTPLKKKLPLKKEPEKHKEQIANTVKPIVEKKLAQAELPKEKHKEESPKKELLPNTPKSTQTQQTTCKKSPNKKVINQDKIKERQRAFIARLVHKINSNKSYPNMARRRSMEGVVDVRFHILSDGNVKSIEIISGKSIFKKATIEAIERSFPIEVDSSLYDFPEVFKIKIAYRLKHS